jgi:PAS domain S-box-containing protein
VALVVVLALGLVGMAGLAIWQASMGSRARMAEQMLGVTRTLAMLVDQEFSRAEAALHGLAAMPDVARGDADAFLQAARRLRVPSVGLAMAEAPGRQVANTLQGLQPQPATMPPGLDRVFVTGETTWSEFYRGRVSGNGVVSIAVPVPPPAGGPPRYAVGMSIGAERMRAVLIDAGLPEGAVAAVLDRSGVVVARTRAQERVVGTRATEPVIRGLAENESGLIGGIRNQDGEVSVVAYARARESGYAVAMAFPEAVFTAERNAAFRTLLLTAAPVAAAGLLVALLLGLRLRGALAGVTLGRGPVLAEVQELVQALAVSDAARNASEAALRDRNAWLEATQRAAQVGTWDYDLRSGALRWSDTMWTLYGLDRDRDGPPSRELFMSRMLEEDHERMAGLEEAARRTGTYEAEFRIRRGDGAVRWIRAQGLAERGADGTPLRILGANLDVTERRELETEREALAARKDLLVAEMHHRVKNSLQLVQGLLLLQARAAEPDMAEKLREAAGRIVSIAAVHRRLYEGGDRPEQDVGDHLSGLVEDLRRSVGGGEREITLEADAGMTLPPERMAALGLLATELVTNALKHGAGAVRIILAQQGDEAVLSVRDGGPGFPEDFDPARSRGLGMRVATAMTRQLRGGLRVEPGRGGGVIVTFPLGATPSSPSPEESAASK